MANPSSVAKLFALTPAPVSGKRRQMPVGPALLPTRVVPPAPSQVSPREHVFASKPDHTTVHVPVAASGPVLGNARPVHAPSIAPPPVSIPAPIAVASAAPTSVLGVSDELKIYVQERVAVSSLQQKKHFSAHVEKLDLVLVQVNSRLDLGRSDLDRVTAHSTNLDTDVVNLKAKIPVFDGLVAKFQAMSDRLDTVESALVQKTVELDQLQTVTIPGLQAEIETMSARLTSVTDDVIPRMTQIETGFTELDIKVSSLAPGVVPVAHDGGGSGGAVVDVTAQLQLLKDDLTGQIEEIRTFSSTVGLKLDTFVDVDYPEKINCLIAWMNSWSHSEEAVSESASFDVEKLSVVSDGSEFDPDSLLPTMDLTLKPLAPGPDPDSGAEDEHLADDGCPLYKIVNRLGTETRENMTASLNHAYLSFTGLSGPALITDEDSYKRVLGGINISPELKIYPLPNDATMRYAVSIDPTWVTGSEDRTVELVYEMVLAKYEDPDTADQNKHMLENVWPVVLEQYLTYIMHEVWFDSIKEAIAKSGSGGE